MDTLDREIKAGRIKVIRIGAGRGRILIPKRAILDYINRRR